MSFLQISTVVSQSLSYICFSIKLLLIVLVYLLDLFQAHGIDHLVIPTRDYLFAPSFADISQAVQFIHRGCFLLYII